MLQNNNGGQNEGADQNKITEDINDKQELQSKNVQRAFEGVQTLKETIEQLKAQTEKTITPLGEEAKGESSSTQRAIYTTSINPEDVRAAEEAVRQYARRDIQESQIAIERAEEARGERIIQAKQREKEAQEKAEQKKREAEEKKRQLEEAEKKAAEMKMKREQAEIQAKINSKAREAEHEEAVKRQQREEKRLQEIEKKLEKERFAELERQRKEAIRLRKKREKERRIEAARIAALEKQKQEERERQEREAKKEAARLAAIERKKEAERIRAEEQRKKEEREQLIAQQRAIQKAKREEEAKRIKEEARRQKELKREREIRRQEEKRRRKEEIRAERARKKELKRQRNIAEKSAELGGGIVSVHGTTVQTQIQLVPAYSIRDLLGRTKSKEIRTAETEEEKAKLLEENQKIKEDARATLAQLTGLRMAKRAESSLFKTAKNALSFCDERKRPMLMAFSILLLIAVGTAAVFNYCTAYEYSYNGKTLGYVKNKDDALQITQIVQEALTVEKKADIVIDARRDINFERTYIFNKDIVIDSSEDVLKRLTYMGDVNIKAYGIYLDGKKTGAVSSKDDAAEVLQKITDKYTNHDKGTEVEKAEVMENIEIKLSNTPLGEVLSQDEMVKVLCTDSEKETLYEVERGESLASIAKDHGITEEHLLADNEGIDPEKLEVGSTLIIHEMAPPMLVRITEKRVSEEKVKYKTIKKKDGNLYEGYTEVDRDGKKGLNKITSRTVSINGEMISSEQLSSKVKVKPVNKVIRVGVKERPPTVGSGIYIWPAYQGTYTVTSEFKWRWGRQHEGIDMGCSTGTDVLASDGGTVVHAGWMGGYGLLVIIDHQNGVKTYYGHNSSLCVNVGDKVFQGQHIAEAGNTGNSFGSHIHFGVMVNGTFQNPRNYLP